MAAQETQLDARKAVYTGSFDPVTLGHLHIIERAARLYDHLIVGVGVNATKQSTFSTDERLELLRQVTAQIENVSIACFSGLAVDFVRSCGAMVMIRGVRPLTDIAGEFTMMMANRQLDWDVETVFLMADEEFGHVSSSLIKQIAAMSDGRGLDKFVPPAVIEPLIEKMRQQNALSQK
jgi:pantetheine-phosphate adenylyltransferase